ncbi:MAG: PAS domain S-box protein [Myxococcales bacterium]|nr:PAS domain S-box protein [Myxococcales bacterium]
MGGKLAGSDEICGWVCGKAALTMSPPGIPDNEAQRLEALESYRVLDTPTEKGFDDLTVIAADALDVPIALVSLVDADRQWFKSRYGLDVVETPRDVSFCGHVVAEDKALVVEDAQTDERFSDNPFVTGEPFVRFYAGCPVRTQDGHVLGTVCAIDHKRRILTDKQRAVLDRLAAQAMHQLEMRRKLFLLDDYSHDATPRSRAEQSAREALSEVCDREARLSAIVGTAVDAIITIDMHGTIETVNPAVQQLFGYAAHELVGQNVHVLMPSSPHRERHDQYIASYMATGSSKIIGVGRELLARRKDGSTFPVELAVSEMRIGDKRMFTGILRDVSERKKIERMQSDFIATVSHELRTPLTSIRGSLGLLAGGKMGELNEQASELITIANNNSSRLVRLVNDILDLEKLESDRLEFQLTEVDLSKAVREAIENNRGLAGEKAVQVELTDELPELSVQTDPDRLAQVLTNLLSNATKFSPDGGVVDVSVVEHCGRARVAVRDRGTGIPGEFRSRIFQRFAQADNSDTRKNGGTGLGLSIAKAIVEGLGGTIGFENVDGGGARFFFELPTLDRLPAARDA